MKLLLADPHRLLIEGLKEILRDSEFEVAAEAYSGAALLPLVREVEPELVLLELALPDRDGFSCLEQLRERAPGVRAVVLASRDGQEAVERALAAGAAGFVSKAIEPADLVHALRAILAGEARCFGLRSATTAEETARELGLSPRELAILKLAAAGSSNRAIANRLFVTEQTVKFHLTNVYRKTGIRNRTGAARFVLAHGLAEDSLLASA